MGKKDEVSKQFLDALEFRGIKRRDFLKYCGATAALLGLSEAFIPKSQQPWKKHQRDNRSYGSISHPIQAAPKPLSRQPTRVLPR